MACSSFSPGGSAAPTLPVAGHTRPCVGPPATGRREARMGEKHGGTRGGARGLPVGGANGFKMHFCAPAVTFASLVFPAACSPGCKRDRETSQEQMHADNLLCSPHATYSNLGSVAFGSSRCLGPCQCYRLNRFGREHPARSAISNVILPALRVATGSTGKWRKCTTTRRGARSSP